MAKMSRINTFNFVGELKFGKDVRATRQLGQSAWSSTRLNVGVKNGENMQFLNVEYIHSDSVKTTKLLGKDGNMFDVDLSMTTNEDIIKNCASFAKIVVDIETDFEKKKEYTKLIFKKMNHERKKDEDKTKEDFEKIEEYTKEINEQANNRYEFVHMKDVVDFLAKNKELLDGKKVRVKGSVKTNYYNGKTNLQYIPSEIELVDSEVTDSLMATVDFFFEKDSIDEDKKERKVFINGYIMDRIKKKDSLVPLTTVIDYSKIDLDNEEHVMLLDFLKGIFSTKDKKQIHKIGIFVNIINGRVETDFDPETLTTQQKMSIKLGMNKIEDFMPKDGVYGERVQELKVINGDFKNYPEGALEVFPIKELDDYLVETTETIKAQVEEEKKTEDITSEMKIMNLFG